MWTSIARRITVPANTTQEVTLYTVTQGLRFFIKRASFVFPEGTASEVSASILYGAAQVIPSSGEATGDGVTLTFEPDGVVIYTSGTPVLARLRNINPTIAKDVIITIEGDEK